MEYIRTTKTDSGLKVRARLLCRHYEKGEKISPKQMNKVVINHFEDATRLELYSDTPGESVKFLLRA